MTVAPDFVKRLRVADERIVARYATIQLETYDRTDMITEVLRQVAPAAVTDPEKHMSLVIEGNPATVMTPCIGGGIGDQQVLPVGEPGLLQARAPAWLRPLTLSACCR